eukprot:211069-Hanusia_phi.AAC.2
MLRSREGSRKMRDGRREGSEGGEREGREERGGGEGGGKRRRSKRRSKRTRRRKKKVDGVGGDLEGFQGKGVGVDGEGSVRGGLCSVVEHIDEGLDKEKLV